MLKLKVDLWNSSMEIMSYIKDNITGRERDLPMIFDTGAYITSFQTYILDIHGHHNQEVFLYVEF